MTLHFLNDVVDTKIDNNVMIVILILTDKYITSFASFDIKFTRLGLKNACWIARQASRFNKHS